MLASKASFCAVGIFYSFSKCVSVGGQVLNLVLSVFLILRDVFSNSSVCLLLKSHFAGFDHFSAFQKHFFHGRPGSQFRDTLFFLVLKDDFLQF